MAHWPRPTGECPTCDSQRGLLCIDCYRLADDRRLPPTYPEYLARAAAYARVRVPGNPQPRLAVALAAVLVFASLVGAGVAQDGSAEVRSKLRTIRARTGGDVFLRVREAQRCAESAIPSDVLTAIERAARGELPPECSAFTR